MDECQDLFIDYRTLRATSCTERHDHREAPIVYLLCSPHFSSALTHILGAKGKLRTPLMSWTLSD